jgi:hypothetical protein
MAFACQREVPAPSSNTDAANKAAAAPLRKPPVRPQDALASQNHNSGAIVDVMEFAQKGRTLTAVLRLRRPEGSTVVVGSRFSTAYVLDEASGKKYVVLADEKDNPIAGGAGGTFGLGAGDEVSLWMKFPALSAGTKQATLVVPDTLPFDDLPVQMR